MINGRKKLTLRLTFPQVKLKTSRIVQEQKQKVHRQMDRQKDRQTDRQAKKMQYVGSNRFSRSNHRQSLLKQL